MAFSPTRIIEAQEAVFISTGPNATGYMLSVGGTGGANLVEQLHRIQSANYSANITHTDVNQYGQLAAIDRIIIQAPTVTLNLDWIVANTYNTNTLGFVTDGTSGVISNILNKSADEKNYFIETVPQGSDAIGDTDPDSSKFTTAISNGFISNFQARGSVGNFATESVTVEGLNYATFIGTTGLPSPAIIPSGGQRVSMPNYFSLPDATTGVAGAVPAIRPGDITLSIPNPSFGANIVDLKIQSYDLSIPLSRQAINQLGSTFPFAREINFPVNVTLSIQAELGDLNTGDLSALFCKDDSNDIFINLAKPQCGGGGPIAVQYQLLGAKLENQSTQSQFGQNKRVSLQYQTQIGGPTDFKNNIIISGSTI